MNWAQKADLWVSAAPDSSGHIEETRALEAAAKSQFVGVRTCHLRAASRRITLDPTE